MHVQFHYCGLMNTNKMTLVDGIKQVKVDFEAKIATVIYDPEKVTIEEIKLASTNSEYPASLYKVNKEVNKGQANAE